MVSLDLKNTLVFILAGGEGKRLKPLTTNRAKPAVPFGGCYRIIDFTLSNCIHSGLRRIHLLTQYQARSLEEHIRFGWNFLPRRLEQFITCRPPHHVSVGRWYRGTADAIWHNHDAIEDWRPQHTFVLSGDHIYHMDYRDMLREHVDHGAALTIGAVRIPKADAFRFGILQTDASGRVIGFLEKPKQNAPEIPGQPGFCLASMGIYVFDTPELQRRLQEDSVQPEGQGGDFGQHVIPRMIQQQAPVFAHHFRGLPGDAEPYWRDVGTIEAYFDANMDLCKVDPDLNLYRPDWPTYTLWHNDPPAKTVFQEAGRRAEVNDSLLAPGTVVSGARVSRSILSNRVYIDENSELDDCIVLRGATVGRRCKLRRVIVDKWQRIPDGETIGFDLERDRQRFHVSDTGIVVVAKHHRFTGQG